MCCSVSSAGVTTHWSRDSAALLTPLHQSSSSPWHWLTLHFSDEISFFINLVWKNHIWLQLIIDVEDVIYCNMLVSLTIYRSVFLSPLPAPAMLTGIVLSSVLMHRNSPETHMVVRQSRLMTHQVAERGGLPLYQLQHNKWRKWTVLVKSRHSLVLCTMYHKPRELKHEVFTTDNIFIWLTPPI